MTTKLTIRDIARLAGVSKSTVSRVLTHSPDVDPATVERVRKVMEEQQFVPSIHASALKGKSQLIGLIVPKLSWDLMPEIIHGTSSVIEAAQHETLLITSDPGKGYKDAVQRALRQVAGVLVVAFAPISRELMELPKKGIPVVLINIVTWDVDLPRVNDDNIGGALRATRHLLGLGYKRIAYIQGPPELPCSHERYQGYCAALREAGLEPNPALLYPGNFWVDDGENAMDVIAQLPPEDRPDAILTSSDLGAWGICSRAEKYGMCIPDDLAVVGYNDLMPSAHMRPALTTIRQPFQEMGACAADLLFSLLDPKYPFPERWHPYVVPHDVSHTADGTSSSLAACGSNPVIQLPTPLIIRSSSGSGVNTIIAENV